MSNKIRKTASNLEVVDINIKGMGVAKSSKGEVFFIKDVVPGDVVDIYIYKKKRGYFEANPTQWLKKSVFRTVPPCQHFGICGGCRWQHLDYKAQLNFKQKGIEHNLKHIGKLNIRETLQTIGADSEYYYRNKMEFSFSNWRWLTVEEIDTQKPVNRNGLGLHKPNMWSKIVNIEKCYLQADPSNEIRNEIRKFAIENKIPFFDIKSQNGFLRTLMIRNTTKGQLMVLLQFFYRDETLQNSILNFIRERFPKITSLLYCVNSKANDSLYDQEINCHYGTDHIVEEMHDLKFKITAKSFYQTNSKQAIALYDIVKDFVDLQGSETIYDLYTGAGTIALYLSKYCGKVIGIELIPEAVEAARENAAFNEVSNAKFEVGDMKEAFSEGFIERHGMPDAVIADPPRDGMHRAVVDRLLQIRPQKIVYVSCNSATQARDLALFRFDYDFAKSQAIDMFPQTHHIENVVLLERKQLDEKV